MSAQTNRGIGNCSKIIGTNLNLWTELDRLAGFTWPTFNWLEKVWDEVEEKQSYEIESKCCLSHCDETRSMKIGLADPPASESPSRYTICGPLYHFHLSTIPHYWNMYALAGNQFFCVKASLMKFMFAPSEFSRGKERVTIYYSIASKSTLLLVNLCLIKVVKL